MKTSMRFDLVDLRLFLFVVEAANITHGATRAGMALASASERIRLMEENRGTPLLERRGVRATAAGAALAHHGSTTPLPLGPESENTTRTFSLPPWEVSHVLSFSARCPVEPRTTDRRVQHRRRRV